MGLIIGIAIGKSKIIKKSLKQALWNCFYNKQGNFFIMLDS